jgi:hypothetical protein
MLYFLIVVLPNLRSLLMGVAFIIAIALILLIVFLVSDNLDSYNEHWEKAARERWEHAKRIAIRLAKLCCITFVSLVFLPSKAEIAILFTAEALSSGISALSQSERIKSLPPKVLNLVHKYLDDSLEGKNEKH